MRVERDGDMISIIANRSEVIVITSALNEVCHGHSIAESEFPSRLSKKKEDVVKILDQIIEVARPV
jgi:hypothetical protein